MFDILKNHPRSTLINVGGGDFSGVIFEMSKFQLFGFIKWPFHIFKVSPVGRDDLKNVES